MLPQAYRITQKRYVARAFDGEGARRYGGRWNSIGTRMVYTAGSLSLATLELLVHVEDYATILGRYVVLPIFFNASLVETVEPHDLPDGWDSHQPVAVSQQFGDAWVKRESSAILAVPSAVTRGETNYLLNPQHPRFPAIQIGDPEDFFLDSRLTK